MRFAWSEYLVINGETMISILKVYEGNKIYMRNTEHFLFFFLFFPYVMNGWLVKVEGNIEFFSFFIFLLSWKYDRRENNLGQSVKDEKLIAVSLKTRKKRFISIYYCGRKFSLWNYNENYIKEFFLLLFFFLVWFLWKFLKSFSFWFE